MLVYQRVKLADDGWLVIALRISYTNRYIANWALPRPIYQPMMYIVGLTRPGYVKGLTMVIIYHYFYGDLMVNNGE